MKMMAGDPGDEVNSVKLELSTGYHKLDVDWVEEEDFALRQQLTTAGWRKNLKGVSNAVNG